MVLGLRPNMKIRAFGLQLFGCAAKGKPVRVGGLLAATALALLASSASAQFGVLDESREIVKGSGPPRGTDPVQPGILGV